MKGIDLSCTSQGSTSIISSNIELISSSSSSSLSPSSSSSAPPPSFPVAGGRAIDRHNPIITDERRRGGISKSTPTTPNYCANNNSPLISEKPRQIQTPPPMISRKTTKKSKKLLGFRKRITANSNSNNTYHRDNLDERKSFSKPSDLMMKVGCTEARPGVDYISPPESSRYLLDDDTSFLDVLSDFDPVMKLVSYDSKKAEVSNKPINAPGAPKPSSSSSGSSDQVVVLRVSLHCRGCERKMKKHLSRMAGVTSFNIDFAAKKVTVVGDVTPLEVLASISKVKTAQLWTQPLSSSYAINSRNEAKK